MSYHRVERAEPSVWELVLRALADAPPEIDRVEIARGDRIAFGTISVHATIGIHHRIMPISPRPGLNRDEDVRLQLQHLYEALLRDAGTSRLDSGRHATIPAEQVAMMGKTLEKLRPMLECPAPPGARYRHDATDQERYEAASGGMTQLVPEPDEPTPSWRDLPPML
jgi:hypothetical protein